MGVWPCATQAHVSWIASLQAEAYRIPVSLSLRLRTLCSAQYGIVNLFALMQYQGKGKEVSPLYFPQAARAGVVISCQTWNRVRSS